MKFIKELLSDRGEVSAIRFSLVCGVVFIACLVGSILWVVFKQQDVVYIDKLVYAIQWTAGIFVTGKIAQKFAETKGDKTTTSETSIEKTSTTNG